MRLRRCAQEQATNTEWLEGASGKAVAHRRIGGLLVACGLSSEGSRNEGGFPAANVYLSFHTGARRSTNAFKPSLVSSNAMSWFR